jgi:hypothetical protein
MCLKEKNVNQESSIWQNCPSSEGEIKTSMDKILLGKAEEIPTTTSVLKETLQSPIRWKGHKT